MNGGSALLCHRTVSYAPCQYPPFPEVGQNAMASVVPERDIKIIAEHPLTTDLTIRKRYPDDYRNPAFQAQMDSTFFKVGETYRFGFCDYVPMKAGKNGMIIAESLTKHEPEVIAGTVGKGEVVLASMGLGQDEKGKEKMNVDDGRLLLNAVYWLVDKK